MFSVYILKSLKDGRFYIGFTGKLAKRIKEHTSGFVISTKYRRPFKLVYAEAYAVEEDARHREHNLKLRAKAMKQLLGRIKKSLAT